MASPLFAFLDTGVLIHGQRIEQVDWPKHLGADEVVLVLPITVINELDKLKDGAQGRLSRDRARDFQARFKTYEHDVLSQTGAKVRDRVWLRVLPDEPVVREGLDPLVQDDRILSALLDFQVTAKGQVVLVARDTGILLKARARGMKAVRLPESLERPTEPDDAEREFLKTKRELDRLQARRPKIRIHLMQDGRALDSPAVEVQLVVPRFARPQDVDREVRAERERCFAGFPILGAGLVSGLFSAVGVSQEDLGRHLELFRSYLQQLALAEQSLWRRVPVAIAVENQGTAPASMVEIDVAIEGSLAFASAGSASDVPVRPVLKPSRPPLLGLSAEDVLPLAPKGDMSVAPKVQPETVSYRLNDLMHNVSLPLAAFHVVLPHPWTRHGFSLSLTVRVAELGDPKPCELNVRTTVLAVEPFPSLRETAR
ncbi:MAG: PIN domain-containing protein [Archangium sp.]|nr:PIN domain-containing protein [Archangium sp.]